jgi:hypothetical protein
MQREKMIILAGQYVLGHLSEQDAVEAEGACRAIPSSAGSFRNGADRLA